MSAPVDRNSGDEVARERAAYMSHREEVKPSQPVLPGHGSLLS